MAEQAAGRLLVVKTHRKCLVVIGEGACGWSGKYPGATNTRSSGPEPRGRWISSGATPRSLRPQKTCALRLASATSPSEASPERAARRARQRRARAPAYRKAANRGRRPSAWLLRATRPPGVGGVGERFAAPHPAAIARAIVIAEKNPLRVMARLRRRGCRERSDAVGSFDEAYFTPAPGTYPAYRLLQRPFDRPFEDLDRQRRIELVVEAAARQPHLEHLALGIERAAKPQRDRADDRASSGGRARS